MSTGEMGNYLYVARFQKARQARRAEERRQAATKVSEDWAAAAAAAGEGWPRNAGEELLRQVRATSGRARSRGPVPAGVGEFLRSEEPRRRNAWEDPRRRAGGPAAVRGRSRGDGAAEGEPAKQASARWRRMSQSDVLTGRIVWAVP
ncbi:hypothetical protein PR202_gb28071 [Eleusine coracana subsp. coracana]|uniref:Uncharacterized protein n=1 Tax=Eleusine coracana subsp. coracana TaxID=191504 RepID=A0AAV5FTD7_ELECO|nr:hypothetical protein PR202_gb28071 [Eleusine coracana subsp. coracana]